MQILNTLNLVIAVLFTVCYAYQFLYIPIVWLRKKRKGNRPVHTQHNFAVLICARNEAAVIRDLISSIQAQTYPQDLIHIFVIADNCEDDTARIAAEAGATVYERSNKSDIGKGYALEALLAHIKKDYSDEFDGYFVFDADNIIAPDYIEQMNKTFAEGHDIITSYRNSKNYGSNWISAGYALWFLRESRYLNHARYLIGTSCAVSGTGFLFSKRVADEIGGWPFHLLTEDIEFSANQIAKGRKIAFCPDAELFDEQPVSFRQSWRQRMRWARGYLQVFRSYGKLLIRGIFKGSFSCFDMSMTIMPAFVLSAISIVCNVVFGIWGAWAGEDILIAVQSMAQAVGNTYLMLFLVGVITTITEWKHIYTRPYRKILFTVTFPIFMFTYIPISFAALFCKTTWKPIKHSFSMDKLSQNYPGKRWVS